MYLLIFFFATTLQYSRSTLVSLRGAEYITYDLYKKEISTQNLNIVFKFKTINPSGLFLFSENTFHGDFISLELIDGRLRYKARLGFEELAEHEVVVGNNLNDYQWHVIHVKLTGRNVSIDLDYQNTKRYFEGDFSQLDLDQKIYFGGVPDDVDLSQYKLTSRKYSGCLKNYFFNDTDILYRSKYSQEGFSTKGDLLWNKCEDLIYHPIMMKYPQDYALVPTRLRDSLSVTFKFRTHIGEGLLFAKISKSVSVHIGLRKNILLFTVQMLGHQPIIMRQGKDLSDGFWHRVEFSVSKKVIEMKLDKLDKLTHRNPSSHKIKFTPGNATIGGGEEQLMPGFVGCMYDIWVDSNGIDYRELGSEYFIGAIGKCQLQDKCLFSPCKHGGKCSQDHLAYKCDCLNTMYSGKNCEESIYQPSCQEYKDLGLNEDSYCYIDPDGDAKIKPFKVLCNMTNHNKNAVTIFEHNLNKDRIPVDNGLLDEGSFYHTLKYGIKMATFDVLLEKAVRCKQFIKFQCKNSYLMRSPRGPPDALWWGRTGDDEKYWGGADPDSETCGCYKNKSCAMPDRYCNCDVGDDIWREDSGYFREIDRLPVSMLIFKTSSNQSYFSVGNLHCEFPSTTPPKNLAKERILKACTSVHYKPTVRTTRKAQTFKQKGRTIIWTHNRRVDFKKNKPTTKVHIEKPNIHNVNVNVTVEFPRKDDGQSSNAKENDGLKFTLSVYAVIVIAVATIIVVIIIAVVVLVKRCQSRRRRRASSSVDESDDDYENHNETTEMCTFFGAVARSERNRPVIEVHRHSFHCDTIDELPPAYREFGDIMQPITHIDLSYKPRKKNLGIFC